MGITTDNATNNDKFMDKLTSWMDEYGILLSRMRNIFVVLPMLSTCVSKRLYKNLMTNLNKYIHVYIIIYIYILQY